MAPVREKRQTHKEKPKDTELDSAKTTARELDSATHRRILTFINAAAIPEDLMFDRPVDLPEAGMDTVRGRTHPTAPVQRLFSNSLSPRTFSRHGTRPTRSALGTSTRSRDSTSSPGRSSSGSSSSSAISSTGRGRSSPADSPSRTWNIRRRGARGAAAHRQGALHHSGRNHTPLGS